MKTIRCMAIDDEPLALTVIEQFCRRIGGIELKTFSDPARGVSALKASPPDIVFLDIEMSEISGLEIARILPPGTCLIFTTAYVNYALDGYDLDAVDFLHKPFSFDRFSKAVNKAVRRISSGNSEDYIIVRQEYSSAPIPLSDIMYVEAMENYVKIYRVDGSVAVSHSSLKNISAMLPGDRFVRIHRSYIVSLKQVTSYTNWQVHLGDKICLPVGRQYSGWQEAFRQAPSE